MHLSPMRPDKLVADDVFRFPVATLDQVVRLDSLNQRQWRVIIEGNDQVDTLQGSQYCKTVVKTIEWSLRRLIQALYRSIGIDANNEAVAQAPGFLQVGNMTAMKNVEAAIGENERFLKS